MKMALKPKAVAEQKILARTERAPVRLKLYAPTVWLIQKHAEPNRCRAARQKLLHQIFLRHARLQHRFDQQHVASCQIRVGRKRNVLYARQRIMFRAKESGSDRRA